MCTENDRINTGGALFKTRCSISSQRVCQLKAFRSFIRFSTPEVAICLKCLILALARELSLSHKLSKREVTYFIK